MENNVTPPDNQTALSASRRLVKTMPNAAIALAIVMPTTSPLAGGFFTFGGDDRSLFLVIGG